MTCKKLVSAAVLLFLCADAAAAQAIRYSSDAEETFLRGVELFRTERYREALAVFDSITRDAPSSQRAGAAAIMKAKALMHLDENVEAARTVREFLSAFPGSSYIPDARYMLGLIYARSRRYDVALESLLEARRLAGAGDTRLRGNILAALDLIIDRHQTLEEVRGMLARSTDRDERTYLMLKAAEGELAGGNAVAAAATADSLDRMYPGHGFAARVESIRRASVASRSVKLGVLMPLMQSAEPSGAKQIGNDVNDGITQAFEEYRNRPSGSVAVSLVTIDTEREAGKAAQGARQLADDPAVVGIIGPVFSQSTEAAARIAATRGIPLVSPTANANGIAAMGPTVFQANADYENRGKAMAQYAVEKRGFRRVAVLAPEEAHGRAMGEAFIAECRRLDAEVVATEWYARGTTDLTQHLQAMRRAALTAATEPMLSFGGRLSQAVLVRLVQFGIPRRRLDSLVERSATVRASSLLGPRARRIIDSLDLPVAPPPLHADSLELAAGGIDAIYLPISAPDEIGVVTSQLVYFNIRSQLLGSGEWNDLKELDANKRYCAGVMFETDYGPDPLNPDYRRYLESATERLGRPPGRYALYGYDAARLVLDLIGRGATSRDALARALGRLADYNGLHCRMGFTDRRVNPWVCIMQYDGERVTRLEDVRVEGNRP